MHKIALCLAFCLAACGGSSKPQPEPGTPEKPPAQATAAAPCIKTGCSSTVCTEPGKDVVTTCEYKPEYGCYKTAACERQSNGACGWTQTAELTACLANPPPGV